jgi:hypothetical protein
MNMTGNVSAPRWDKVPQYQQHQRPQPSQRLSQGQRHRQPLRDGFDPEWLNGDVEIEQLKGMNTVVIRGRVIGVSKYWIKILTNGEVIYLNKAFIVSIKPAMIKDASTPVGVSVNPYGGEKK